MKGPDDRLKQLTKAYHWPWGEGAIVASPASTSDLPAEEDGDRKTPPVVHLGHVLVAEDDPVVRGRAARMLANLGYRVTAVSDGQLALEIITANKDVDLLLADVVMPVGMNGWELAERARAAHPGLKVLLTSGFVAQIAAFQLNDFPHVLAKPYLRSQFELAVASAIAPTETPFIERYGGANIYIIDTDSVRRRSTVRKLTSAGFTPSPYVGVTAFLEAAADLRPGGVLLETRMFEPDCIEVISALGHRLLDLPLVVIADQADLATAVRAMKSGASDFIERPFEENLLLEALDAIFIGLGRRTPARNEASHARRQLARLTDRQAEVLQGLVDGLSNKGLAFRLNVSIRTIEVHRANMMDRLGVATLPDALRMAFDARNTPSN